MFSLWNYRQCFSAVFGKENNCLLPCVSDGKKMVFVVKQKYATML